MLPNLVIIGAQKCGTTSLHYYLNLHPEITMSAEKELNFFIEERNWHKGIGWYEKQFLGKTPIRGEASPNYTYYPIWDRVPEHMHSVIPDAKLIYILRDPIKRMVAEYSHHYSDGNERRPINEALQNFDSPRFSCRSLYSMQLQRYLQYYPLSQILILTQEDLHQHRRQTLKPVFGFLDVDESFDCKQFARMKHQTVNKRQKNKIGIYLKRLSEAKGAKIVSADVRSRIGKVLYYPFSSKIDPPKVEPIVKQKIAAYLREDIEQLRQLTGMKFDQWDV